jgi:hypothetical protein
LRCGCGQSSVAGDELSGAMIAGGTSITFDTAVDGSQI